MTWADDEFKATKVPLGNGYWAGRCLKCSWAYSGQCRTVDMAMRAHVAGCGGDAEATRVESNGGVKLMLRLERDVLGRVVSVDLAEALSTEDEQWMKDFVAITSAPSYPTYYKTDFNPGEFIPPAEDE